MTITVKNGTQKIPTLAYFKDGKERRLAFQKIKDRRPKLWMAYNLLPKKEKITILRNNVKYRRLNPQKVNISQKKWNKKNIIKVRGYNKKTKLKHFERDKKVRGWIRSHRKEILLQKGEKCEECGSIEKLEIHHKKYTNNLQDLQLLCMICHRKVSRKYSDEELGIRS